MNANFATMYGRQSGKTLAAANFMKNFSMQGLPMNSNRLRGFMPGIHADTEMRVDSTWLEKLGIKESPIIEIDSMWVQRSTD